MIANNNRQFYAFAAAVFIGLPILLWAASEVPNRTALSEALSLATLLAFSLTLGVFYFTRAYVSARISLKMGPTIKWHRRVGYLAVAVLLLHPLLIVLPRAFASGVAPIEAFVTMIATWESPGILMGIIAWCLMLVLGLTALLRKRLPLNHTIWRAIHGMVAVLFIVLGTWHAIVLGRHTNLAMSLFMAMLAAGGVLLLWKTYFREAYGQERTRQS
jgi:predicted ferric reductase